MGRVKTPPDRRLGFTLIELLIVLAMMATLAAFSWPSVRRSVRRSELLRTATRIEGMLHEARLAAVRGGTPHVMRLSANGRALEWGPLDGDTLAKSATSSVPGATPLGENDFALTGTDHIVADAQVESNTSPIEADGDSPTAANWKQRKGFITLPEKVTLRMEKLSQEKNVSAVLSPLLQVSPVERLPQDQPVDTAIGSDVLATPIGSKEIKFWPEGESTSFRLTLQNDVGNKIEIEWKGLLGESSKTVSKISPETFPVEEPIPKTEQP